MNKEADTVEKSKKKPGYMYIYKPLKTLREITLSRFFIHLTLTPVFLSETMKN